jgi:putative ABC transport system permease protein
VTTVFRVAYKSAMFNKRRLIGSALSIVIGIAFLAGTFVFTDTIQRTFDTLFADVYEATDAYVRSSDGIDIGFGQTVYDRLPETVVDEVNAVDGVVEAVAEVSGSARIIGSDGKPVGDDAGAPNVGSSVVDSPLIPWRLVGASRYPHGPDEVMIDQGSASEGKFRLGDSVTVVSQGGSRTFTLVGTVRFGNADSPGGAHIALFDLPTAQSFVGKPGEIDAVLIRAGPDLAQQVVADRVQAKLGGKASVLTGREITEESQSSIREALSFFNIMLLVFAAIALFVGSFIIYNTFSIVVAQKQRESALLRALGASRLQIVSSVMIESVIVGLIASATGFVAGIGMSPALKTFVGAFGVDIPAGGMVLRPRTAVVSLAVGVLMTALAAVFPSLRASRIAPVAAMRDLALDRSATSKGRLAAGALVTATGVALVVIGLAGDRVKLLAGGVPVLFIGMFVVGPLVARPAAGFLGSPLPHVAGMTGTLARQNSMRNPRRTARTAAALMIGVALVTGISVLAVSIKSSIRSIISDQFTGDFVVNTRTQGVGGLPPELSQKLNDLPEVGTATGIQIGYGMVQGHTNATALSVVDPMSYYKVFDLNFVQGQADGLDSAGILVSKRRADQDGLAVGDTVTLSLLDGVQHQLTVRGIYEKDDLAGSYAISRELFQTSGADLFDFAVFGTTAPGVSEAQTLAAVEAVTKAYPTGRLLSRASYIDEQSQQINQFVNLIYGLLALAVVIALFGIANTLSLSVYERTRELGLLRAVGAFRSQVRAMVRWESVITALLGTAQGILIGLLLGYAVIISLRDEGLTTFSVPITALIFVVVLAFVAGVIAAIRPARRAANLHILDALAKD